MPGWDQWLQRSLEVLGDNWLRLIQYSYNILYPNPVWVRQWGHSGDSRWGIHWACGGVQNCWVPGPAVLWAVFLVARLGVEPG